MAAPAPGRAAAERAATSGRTGAGIAADAAEARGDTALAAGMSPEQAAASAVSQPMVACKGCGEEFLPMYLPAHQRGCEACKPAKAAGASPSAPAADTVRMAEAGRVHRRGSMHQDQQHRVMT